MSVWRTLLPAGLALAFTLGGLATPARAHHILGIPHYAYLEEYPQAPVLTYLVEAGAYELRMTGYPGILEPGDRCSLHVYLQHIESGAPFAGGLTLTVTEDRLIGTDPVIYGPMHADLQEAVYKFYPRFGHEANYLARLEFEVEGVPWIIDVPMLVGAPGSPWAVLGGVAGATVLFLIVVRALRIKMRRRARETAGQHATSTHKNSGAGRKALTT